MRACIPELDRMASSSLQVCCGAVLRGASFDALHCRRCHLIGSCTPVTGTLPLPLYELVRGISTLPLLLLEQKAL